MNNEDFMQELRVPSEYKGEYEVLVSISATVDCTCTSVASLNLAELMELIIESGPNANHTVW